MHTLIGKTILAAFRDGANLILVCGPKAWPEFLELSPYIACCNKVWIEHIDGSERLLGTVAVIEVVDNGVVRPLDPDEYSWDSVCSEPSWAYRVITELGICTIEMRNDATDDGGYNYEGYLEVRKVSVPPTAGDIKPLVDF
jgi:hypothetical protein